MALDYISLWIMSVVIAFMAGLWLHKEAENKHWRCAFMPWKCPYAGSLFIYALGVSGMLIIVLFACGQKGLGLL